MTRDWTPRNTNGCPPWECAMCGKTHEYWPNLSRDVHYPTRAAAEAMGYKLSTARVRPPACPPELLAQMQQAADVANHRAAACTVAGMDDMAGAWTRTAADLAATVNNRRKFEALPGPLSLEKMGQLTTGCFTGDTLASQTTPEVVDNQTRVLGEAIQNMFTGRMEKPHEPPKKRGRK